MISGPLCSWQLVVCVNISHYIMGGYSQIKKAWNQYYKVRDGRTILCHNNTIYNLIIMTKLATTTRMVAVCRLVTLKILMTTGSLGW
jgi:hypothetical protein